MTTLTQLFVLTTTLTAALALIGIWAPRRLALKVGALAIAVMFLPLAYASLAELLGRSKPITLAWWQEEAAEAAVLGSVLREGDGIHLWLQLPEAGEPRAFVLPWDRDLAEQLQQASREAEERQSELRMRLPFEPSFDDREPRFYALPQPALPPKDVTDPPPETYQHPGQDA